MGDINTININMQNSLAAKQRVSGAVGSHGGGQDGLPSANIFEALIFKSPKKGILEALGNEEGWAQKTINVWGIQPTFVERIWKSGAPKSESASIG